MERYLNKGGNSNIESYEIGKDYISVQFKNSGLYLYNYEIPGPDMVEKMKALALEGRGLNAYN